MGLGFGVRRADLCAANDAREQRSTHLVRARLRVRVRVRVRIRVRARPRARARARVSAREQRGTHVAALVGSEPGGLLDPLLGEHLQ